jgi:tetratricopeptide (TPR) repeat protein
MEVLLAAKTSFLQLPAGAEQYCWLAKVEFLIAELTEARGDRRSAQRAFTESERWAERALKANKSSSIAHQLLADTYMRLMDYKGALYTMSKGPQALKLLNTATSLDPNNYPAFISLATYYLNAPAIGGGSVKKGVEALEKALKSTDEHDLFLSNLWLGVAYRKLKKEDEAQGYFSKALTIYPQSPWAKEWMNARK